MSNRKISPSNMIERLNREIRRRTNVIGIFPNESSYVRLITTYLMEYAEEWSTSTSYIRKEAVASLLNEEVA
ncbi:MAG: transposase [Anaerovoracaceae bacterium]